MLNFSGIPATLYARNPRDPNQYVLTNGAGSLFVADTSGALSRLSESPFSRFEPTTVGENQYYVEAVAWSPDGVYLAFIIDGEQHPDPTNEDGLHIHIPTQGQTWPVLRDAPSTDHPGYQAGGERQFLHDSETLEWAPQGDMILVRARLTNPELTGQNRGVLLMVPRNQNPALQPAALRYDYGSWTADGQRVVVSGRNAAGTVVLGIVNRDGSGEQIFFNASARGLWLQNAVQRLSDGQILALGRPGDANGPMRLYDMNGNALTGDIGTGPPQRVSWSPDRSVVLVAAGGRQYVVYVDTRVIQDITAGVGNSAVSWMTGGIPATNPNVVVVPESGFIPSGVIEGSRFQAGQQVRIIATTGLNFRQSPTTNSTIIGRLNQGDVVAILAGPVHSENVEWWRVQEFYGYTGWVAGAINGVSTMGE